MRLALISLLMIPLAVGCGDGDKDESANGGGPPDFGLGTDDPTVPCEDDVARIVEVEDSISLTARFNGEYIVATWAEPGASSEQAAVMVAKYDKTGIEKTSAVQAMDLNVTDLNWSRAYLHTTLGVSGTNTLVAAHTRAYSYGGDGYNSVVKGQVFDESITAVGDLKILNDQEWDGRPISAWHPSVFPKGSGFRVLWSDWRLEEPNGYGQIYHVEGMYYSDVSASGSVSSFDTQVSQEWAYGMDSLVRGVHSRDSDIAWIAGSDGGNDTVWTNEGGQTDLTTGKSGGDLDFLDMLKVGGTSWLAVIEDGDSVQVGSSESRWSMTPLGATLATPIGTRLVNTDAGVFVVWVEASSAGEVTGIGIAPVEDPLQIRVHSSSLSGEFVDIQDIQFVDGVVEMVLTTSNDDGSFIDFARICVTSDAATATR